MADIKNPARERLAGGAVSIGVGLRLARGAEIGRIMKSCGWDWLFIDLDHGSMSLDTASQISVAALDSGIAPIVRVPHGQLDMATRALDGGGWGIVMPHVDTPEEAAELVAHVKYPPQGHRSVMGALPQFGYRGLGVGEAAKIVNAEMLVTVMIETPTALANAEAIAAMPGVDVLLIGTNDLAMEMGIPGQFAHPQIVAAYEKVIAACRGAGKWPGMGGCYADDLLRKYIAMGMRMILGGNDLPFLMAGATDRAKVLKTAPTG
ncbi:MAG TPA: aldolase/citrate lyase family protein [Stellaceae bacterium]|nr:aldolase/citrate lyase family protein [Stellaceae bacterium]